MSKATHTSGPWLVFIGGKVVEVQDVSGKPVAHWAGFDSCDRPLIEQKANARLIAAAPDLLAACEAARKWLGPMAQISEVGADYSTLISLQMKLDAAIATAKGK